MSILKRTYEVDRIHDEWEAIYRGNALQDSFNRRILDRIISICKPPPAARWLDAGCGMGDHTIRIAKRGYDCMGLDVSSRVLARAKTRAAAEGVSERVGFAQAALESLPFAEGDFDVVHCRGVLMHVPRWEEAVRNLCQVLKPGGHIVILESNCSSVEAWVVRLVRVVLERQAVMIRTDGGIEFWSYEGGSPFVVRHTDIGYLKNLLRRSGVIPVAESSAEFFDIGRAPAGLLRQALIRCNMAYFISKLPARFSMGVIIVGEKRA